MSRVFAPRLIFYLLLLLCLDLSLVPVFQRGMFQPVLLYLMVLYAAFEWEEKQALVVALLVGLLRDALSAHAFGVETTVVLLLAWALNLVIHKLERESTLMRLITTFVFVLLALSAILLLAGYLRGSFYGSWRALGVLFTSALMTTLVAPAFFYLTVRWFHDRPFLKQHELFGS